MDSTRKDFKFDWVEYSTVAMMLLFSVMIGIYYTFFKKQNTYTEYMLGGKKMGVFPVSMSLVASFISGITLMGVPVEIYVYGTQYMISNIANIIVFSVTGIFYLPVYYKLQLNSVFEYLELRFSRTVRIMGSLMYSTTLILYLPVVMYVPALAFNQVTDVPVHVITPIICISCLFYTAFGGLKAVLWTDALQNTFMFLAVIFILVLGCNRVGGIQEILRITREGSRLEFFNLDPSPFTRNTFWNVILGNMFIFLTNIAANPGSVQRFLSVPSLKKARLVLLVSCIGFYAINNLAMCLGLVLYARYHGCDPVASGMIKSHTQMMPLYVMEVGKDYPGLAGLFMSGVLSAALSTMSSWLNTVGGTLYKDIKEVFFPNVEHSESKQSTIIKIIILVLGALVVALVAVVESLGTVLQVANSLLGIMYGSFLALFTVGIFIPQVNNKGAICGTIASLLLTGWIVFNAQYAVLQGKLKFPGKITSIDECPRSVIDHYHVDSSLLFNYTAVGTPVMADSSLPLIYQLSYNYYIVLGALTGITVGVLVSLLSPCSATSISPDVVSPYVQRFLPSHLRMSQSSKNDSNVSLLFNYTGYGSPVITDMSTPVIYKLSYWYYIVLGSLTGIVVGFVVSLFTSSPDITLLNPDLFSPYVFRLTHEKHSDQCNQEFQLSNRDKTELIHEAL